MVSAQLKIQHTQSVEVVGVMVEVKVAQPPGVIEFDFRSGLYLLLWPATMRACAKVLRLPGTRHSTSG